MIANLASMDIKPGSMGRPLPGIDATVFERDAEGHVRLVDGRPVEVTEPGGEGELALRAGWPSMFRAYLNEPERYRRCFAGGWYLTGDLVRRDAEGYFWFVGRGDDVIKTSGHLIGPFEVESVLLEHPAVAEAGVIGVPDPVAGELVKAFVLLAPGVPASDALRRELLAHARRRLGAAVAPREIAFSAVAAAHAQRQDHAAAAASAGAGPRPGRPVDAGAGRMSVPDVRALPVEREHGLALLREMLRIRRFEEACAELYSATKIRGFLHLYIGEEAVAVGVMQALTAEDAIVATYREHGHALVRGVPPGAVMAEMFGRAEGCSRGRGGSMHLFDVSRRFYGGNAIVAGGLPLAVGMALADRMQGRRRVTACFFGEGAVAEGEFHESMNLAALWRLPVLFCCENNLYAMGTALSRSESETDLTLKASSYEMAAWSVDGMDVLAVEDAAQRAATAVRDGMEPLFLELQTYRFRAHSMYDPDLYRSKEEIERWKQHDPDPGAERSPARRVRRLRRRARRAAGLGRRRGRRRRGVRRGRHTGAGRGPRALRDLRGRAGMTYREAMREAIREAMRADERVFLMGEDVGPYGGSFGVSRGLLDEFGPERIRDTPLSESGFVGAGIGAAIAGMRPSSRS